MVRASWRAFRGTWRLGGFRGLVEAFWCRLYRRQRFIRFGVELREWRIVDHPSDGLEAREGTPEELVRARAQTNELTIAFYADIARGARRFYVGLIDGEIRHISWVFAHGDPTLQMALAPDEIMLDSVYTVPAFRGRGLLPVVQRAILDDAKRQGYRYAYTHVEVDNVASIRGVRKTGFRPIGELHRLWVLGIPISRYVAARPEAAAILASGANGASPRRW